MEHTANFGLTQWEKTDRIQMEDFNADNAILEAALSKCGNCRIETGIYTGTGTFGSANPTVLSFSAQPEAVFITDAQRAMLILCGCERAFQLYDTGVNHVTVTWADTAVSWYHTGNAASQFNSENTVHTYFALFRVDK